MEIRPSFGGRGRGFFGVQLSSYRSLGRSGLIVSPLALGAMTFGTNRWGIDEAGAHAILDRYFDAGGNFVDTADVYAAGRSEEIVGRFIADRGMRDWLVVATKFTWNQDPGNPKAGGNGRKNIIRALDASCRRLQVDYVDLYWLHFWDMVTPVEEVLTTLTDLIRVGRIRYYALSDVPAWYLTRMATLAAESGLPSPIALQTQYSLVERAADYEHFHAARELGIGVVPWSPLAGGFLTGKYHRGDAAPTGDGRLASDNPLGQTPFTDRNWAILDVVRRVAAEVGRTPAEVALAWTVAQSGVDAVLIGASQPDQLAPNVEALDLALTVEQHAALDEASAPPQAFPWNAFTPAIRQHIFGGTDVTAWRQ